MPSADDTTVKIFLECTYLHPTSIYNAAEVALCMEIAKHNGWQNLLLRFCLRSNSVVHVWSHKNIHTQK